MSKKDNNKSFEEKEMSQKLNIYHEELYFQNKELLNKQEKLEIKKDFYKKLFDEIPGYYIIYTLDNTIFKANKKFYEKLNLESYKKIEDQISDFIKEKDQDKFYFHKKKILDENKTEKIHIEFLEKEAIMISNKFIYQNTPYIKSIIVFED
ncbi:MAG: hypothetical protein ACQEQE_05110 [Bacillota bacterium]